MQYSANQLSRSSGSGEEQGWEISSDRVQRASPLYALLSFSTVVVYDPTRAAPSLVSQERVESRWWINSVVEIGGSGVTHVRTLATRSRGLNYCSAPWI